MQIGILSDTHGKLPTAVLKIFNNVQHIFHAGDIGDISIIHELETICPVSAIHGNIDPWPIPNLYPNILVTSISGLQIVMKHDIVAFKEYSYELFKKRIQPDIVIYGHTHQPMATYYRNIYYINPGSTTKPRSGYKSSVVILTIDSNDSKKIDTRFYELEEAGD